MQFIKFYPIGATYTINKKLKSVTTNTSEYCYRFALTLLGQSKQYIPNIFLFYNLYCMSCNLSHLYVQNVLQHLYETFCAVPTYSKNCYTYKNKLYKLVLTRTHKYYQLQTQRNTRNTTKYMYTYEIYTLYNL